MNSKKSVLFLLLLTSAIVLYAARSLNAATAESVILATDRHAASGHADRSAVAFTNWDSANPPVIPARCAKCHSTSGYLDWLGEDGSASNAVDQDAPLGTVITCMVCHNPSAHKLAEVAFHSGAQIRPVRVEAACVSCHQTLQSTDGIQMALNGLVEDAVAANLSFVNPHYKSSASIQFGSLARSGYQYPGQSYAGRFAHAPGAESCTDCHNPHSLAVQTNKCAACHANVVGRDDLASIRMQKSDYDGDLDAIEGIRFEVKTLQEQLLEAIQGYARTVAQKPVVYHPDQFPYFFVDANANGSADAAEINNGNRYNAWTPRLLKAAYNYQLVKKDPGAYVHNPRYVIQLLQDSLSDLGTKVALPSAQLPRP
jgi:hypothetical protein